MTSDDPKEGEGGSGMPRKVDLRNPDDPLGYDTSDFLAFARQYAEDALSGRNEEAVQRELAAIRRRFGPRDDDGKR